MNISQIISELESPSSRNATLRLLAQIMVDTDPRLTQSLTKIIKTPEVIEDTGRFASILERLSQADFIPPLIESICKSEPGQTPWLADYMYTLGSLLMDQKDFWRPEEEFVHLLGKWLHTTGGGEIAWKSAVILSQLDHPATHDYYLSGAIDQSLFSQARGACINGIVNLYREEAETLLEKLRNDPDPDIREKVVDAFEWLKNAK